MQYKRKLETVPITTLFLDIGGVLLSNGWGHVFRHQAAAKFNLDQQELDDRHKIMFATYEEGHLTLEEYLNHAVFHQKRDFSLDEFRDFMFSLTTPNADMIDFFKSLKLHYNLKIVAVSNEARELNAHRINTFKLNSFIDFFVSSCYVNIRKPDNRIFEMALDLSNVDASEVLFIDDTQLFVDVAVGLGVKSICHANYLSTIHALAELGLPIKPKKLAYAL